MALRGKQQRFVDEYLIDRNATQAAIRAGYSAKTAGSIGDENLKKPEIKKAIEAGEAELAERNKITQDKVLNLLWDMATADPNELIKYVRVNCRYCWGEDHYYQWTKGEYHNACYNARANQKPKPDCDGGFGFDKTKVPNPDCPECRGEGVGYTHVSDTTRVSSKAKLLYAGIKENQYGVEIKMNDQFAAAVKAGQHIGMFKERVEHSNDPENPLTDTKASSRKLAALAKLKKAKAKADKDKGNQDA
ncbi:terminase small subunit [Acinetobacter pittii]|uniref:terminase small subunit n=1 Tax=Acinetobacter calcoaceticus/baumannii complex TaxID=909768 RepID=UPI0004498352|nr:MULTISPECIES: terminase small subunit [Acinetobacter calcoaceticus/baumannii complex]AUT34471.1 terminase small subunit [Acinetobacter pittii]EXG31440.1 terminase small subunit [Acinetobacter sp. 263903-2]KQF75500.1 terminase small subunit [Acinetobacter pittii]KRJ07158.1 terminase small subunit [Acinetobacter pittii]MCE6395684.1 terminase small subunit [Acinetobacter pittii]